MNVTVYFRRTTDSNDRTMSFDYVEDAAIEFAWDISEDFDYFNVVDEHGEVILNSHKELMEWK